ncbi:hypothetical protein GQ43DRAFT_466553 [Delitschia confertaspora ATCC 74209]|uniref:Uncharacterized protein n=1 Tax=Delitschia confertaspora ATCC 74209 TaxID=1513339 RepID=A0A9P4JD52_9PLEO|nr:hypothetical protein GQ43DRAFT_466553 [Delitschia confertaspora ATCC 74209]
MLHRPTPPSRTPSPKVRIHRSQSFGSPSSRLKNSSPVPRSLSPFSKSTSAIIGPLSLPHSYKKPRSVVRHISHKVVLHAQFDDSDSEESISSADASPVPSPDEDNRYMLFNDTSPLGSPIHPTSPHSASPCSSPSYPTGPSSTIPHSSSQGAQDTTTFRIPPADLTPVWDPWLVRLVLDMYDKRGFDWTCIAEAISTVWGVGTCSAEVLGILQGNGRVRGAGVWWD